MSKIAKNPVIVPEGVSVELAGQEVKAKGSKGELSLVAHGEIIVTIEDGESGKVISVAPRSNSRQARALWGTTWANIRNIVVGVNEGYSKVLEIHGVGYRANLQGQNLLLNLGFSHDVTYPIPEGIKIEVEKQTKVTVIGIDKQRVGQVAAEIRSFRPPEPYKGKGIRYKDEYIFRKEGKKK